MEPLALLLAFLDQDVRGLREPDDARYVERSRPVAALVPATVHLSDQSNARLASPHVQSTDALRPIHLVCRDRSQVDVHRAHVEIGLADALDRVDVQEHALLA